MLVVNQVFRVDGLWNKFKKLYNMKKRYYNETTKEW